MPKDLRTFLRRVIEKQPGSVKVIDEPVDARFDITAWGERFARAGDHPAFIFTNVTGSVTSCVTNLAATWERLALALGLGVEELRKAGSISPSNEQFEPLTIPERDSPVKEIKWDPGAIDLTRLPIPTHNSADGGPYLTAAVGIMRDPDSGAVNAGIYRHQVHDARTLGVWFFGSHHGGSIYRRYEERDQPAPIALAIGHHPAFLMGAISRVPGIGGEYRAAGAFMREPVPVVNAETADLPVPAYAEIVIEGEVLPGERREEGPFAEWPGLYTVGGAKPLIRVTAVTMRHDAIFQDIQAAGQEHRLMGALPRILSVRNNVSNVVDHVSAVNIPLHARMHCYVSIKKTNDGEPTRAAFAALNTEPENLRLIVVVDDDIDVYNEQEVQWAIGTRFDAERDLQVIPHWNGPGGLLPTNWRYDSSGSREPTMSSAMILDATKPAPPVGYPQRAFVTPEAVANVRPEVARDVEADFRPPSVS